MSDSTIDPELADITAKVEAGKRLSLEDGLQLYETRDIHTLGQLASTVRERLHGKNAYYNINRHINYTNACILRCKFCSFYRPYPKDGLLANVETRTRPFVTDGALPILNDSTQAIADRTVSLDVYELSIDEIVRRAEQASASGSTEVHIVGGLHPKLPFEFYTDMCRAIRAACPQLHIKAFTAIEIIHFSRISRPRKSIRQVLQHLQDAGLCSLPGGGAEIFDNRVHDEAYKNKVGEQGWFDVHRTAHELGMYSNATMLYGHIEQPEDRIRHMIKLREHQDQSIASRPARFNCFVPLSFIPEGSSLSHLPGPTGLEDLKTLAVSRLMLDNFEHIKSFWIMHSPKLSQVSLSWGVDDLDGTVVWYDITKREGGGGTTHQELHVDDLKRLIAEAGFRPVERDTLYHAVQR